MASEHSTDDSRPAPRASGPGSRVWWIVAGVFVVVVIALAALFWPRGNTVPVAGPVSTTSATPTASPSVSVPSGTPTAPAAPQPGEPAPPAEAPPIGFDEPAEPVPGVIFTLAGLEPVEGEAEGPGEVAGPAIRFRLAVQNNTAADVSLATTVVNVYGGPDAIPAQDLRGPGGVPLPASIAPGQSVEAVLVFTLPLDQRDVVRIAVDYAVGVPIVVFEGAAPR